MIDWAAISLEHLAGFISEELKKEGSIRFWLAVLVSRFILKIAISRTIWTTSPMKT